MTIWCKGRSCRIRGWQIGDAQLIAVEQQIQGHIDYFTCSEVPLRRRESPIAENARSMSRDEGREANKMLVISL